MADTAIEEATETQAAPKEPRYYLDRLNELESERSSWEAEWKQINKYVFPRRSIFSEKKGQAQRVGQDIYDGTAIMANNMFANGLMGYFISQAHPWFKNQLPWEEANELPDVREWLDTVEKTIYDDFHNSNFYEEAVEILKDAGALGTACLFMEEDEKNNRPIFLAIHPKEFYIDTDKYGRVDTVYRSFYASVKQLVDRFGYENCSGQVQGLYNSNQLTERVEVLHCVEPREERDSTMRNKRNKRFASVYLEQETEVQLDEGGYDVFPYFVLRLSTNSDEKYGRGPGSDALVDVLRLNRMSKDLLKQSNKLADPPVNVPEEMRNRTDFRPGGENYISRPDMVVSPIEQSPQFALALDREQWLRERIEEHFMVDLFMMMQRIGATNMTATEVMERQAEKAAVLGTLIGRIASDFLDPLINAMFVFGLRSQRIPAPPNTLAVWMQRTGRRTASLGIDYIGPLAQAQKKFHATRGIKQAMSAVFPIAQIRPEVMDNFNWDEISRELTEAEGLPARLFVDERVVMQIREQKMRAQQEAMQQQQQMQGAEAYQKMKDAPGEGSPMQGINEMLRGAMGGGQGAVPAQ